MSEPTRPVRRGRLLRLGAAVVVLLAVAGYVVTHYLTGGRGAARCAVVSGMGDGASYEFSSDQAVNAATIAAVGTARGMPERAVTIALATALQESGLRNITHGDRDSVGLFQQRPSQGWGTAEQIQDPVYSAAEFYRHLDEVAGYSRLPLTVAAQRVQRSGFPQAYAKHEPDATLLSAALTGRSEASLTCEDGDAVRAASPSAVRTALVRDFGRGVLQPAGATVAGEDTPPASAAPSPRMEGRALLVPVPRGQEDGRGSRQRGWELAHWAVANAAALGIDKVSYAGREWTGDRWRDTGAGAAGRGPDQVRIVTGQ